MAKRKLRNLPVKPAKSELPDRVYVYWDEGGYDQPYLVTRKNLDSLPGGQEDVGEYVLIREGVTKVSLNTD